MDDYYRVIGIESDGGTKTRYALGLAKARRIANEYPQARIEDAKWCQAWLVEFAPSNWTADYLDIVPPRGNA